MSAASLSPGRVAPSRREGDDPHGGSGWPGKGVGWEEMSWLGLILNLSFALFLQISIHRTSLHKLRLNARPLPLFIPRRAEGTHYALYSIVV